MLKSNRALASAVLRCSVRSRNFTTQRVNLTDASSSNFVSVCRRAPSTHQLYHQHYHNFLNIQIFSSQLEASSQARKTLHLNQVHHIQHTQWPNKLLASTPPTWNNSPTAQSASWARSHNSEAKRLPSMLAVRSMFTSTGYVLTFFSFFGYIKHLLYW